MKEAIGVMKEKVIECVKKMPDTRRLLMFGKRYSREMILEEIQNDTEVGRFIIEIYSDALKKWRN